MQSAATASELRACVDVWRRDGMRVGFVPTMGNLHAGHYSLVEIAREHCDRVVASVFVNPTQFGPGEDFSTYPRTLDEDRRGLQAHGCDLLFTPGVSDVYPFGAQESVRVEVPVISATLEGALRPGHFSGVATVVTKLFNLVQPQVAVFGQKDYQQLLVIRRLVTDLALPIEIIGAPTRREPNGLAMSSRNQYLSAAERELAGVIRRTLESMRAEVQGGASFAEVEQTAQRSLLAAGLSVDYAVIRDAADLSEAAAGRRAGLVALIAAKLGRARLIDNLLLEV